MDHHHMCDLSHAICCQCTAAMRAMPMSRGGVGAVRSARRTTIGPPLGAGVDTAPAPGGVSGRAGPGGIREEDI
jgi:hypothetical protein